MLLHEPVHALHLDLALLVEPVFHSLHCLVFVYDAVPHKSADEHVRLLDVDLDIVCCMANVSGREPLLRDLLGDAPVLVFVALVLPLIDAVELQVLGIPPGTQYVMPQLVPVTTSGSGDHACTGVEVTPDGGVGDALALIGLLVFIVLGVNLVVLEEGAEGIGNRVHRHDDLWLGLSIEPGDECEVASGGVTRDGEAGGIDGARAFQLLDESL
jgi:hypothetical protein